MGTKPHEKPHMTQELEAHLSKGPGTQGDWRRDKARKTTGIYTGFTEKENKEDKKPSGGHMQDMTLFRGAYIFSVWRLLG